MVFLFGEDLLLSCLWIVSGELVSFVDVVLMLEWSGAIGRLEALHDLRLLLALVVLELKSSLSFNWS